MTREDAIKILNTVLLFGKCDCPKEEIEECLKMAIKALEQETVLDKIRAEIIELRSKQNVGVMECLDIIDKYIESEE